MLYDSTSNEVMYSSATTTTSKTFVIDHPKDENKYLVHACLEGPESGVYYRGTGEIVQGLDNVEIELPSYVESLAKDFTIQITPIYNETGNVLLSTTEIKDNKFTVYGTGKFFWQVFGKRSNIEVEPLKNNVNVFGDGPYRYIG
jgi:hypothetical protein